MNWKGCGRKRSWYNFKLLSQHLPGRAEKNHETLRQDSRSPVRGLKLRPPEYELGVLTTRP
jgi:hypothetical protein